jgi:hypothetical protein
MAITVAPLTTVVMSSCGPAAAGVASGINNAVSRVAALLAIALLGIVMAYAFNRTLEQRLATLPLPAEAVHAVQTQRDKLAGITLPSDIEPEAHNALQQAIGESFVYGYRAVMILGALLAFASAGLALVRISGTSLSPGGRGPR